MLVDVENSKSITYYAAWAMDEGVAEAPLAVSMAKAYVSDAFRRVSAAGIQLHGTSSARRGPSSPSVTPRITGSGSRSS
jgi:alkylation response protein AidB-like acyl-CoA dehydrogenase